MKAIASVLTLLLLMSSFLSAGCGPTLTLGAELIAEITAAENIHFTQDNRLFITGGEGLFEVSESGGTYQVAHLKGNCDATGMAQMQGWIFFNCASLNGPDYLWAYELGTGQLAEVAELTGFALANGMAALDNVTLLIANFDILFSQGAIARVTIDFSGVAPQIQAYDPTWAAGAEGLITPNGVRISGDRVYFTDLDTLRYLQLDGSNELVSVESLPAPSGPYYDDLEVDAGSYILLTDFLGGIIHKVNGNCAAQTPQFHTSTSSVRIGQGSFTGKLLVTDRLGSTLTMLDMSIIENLPCS